MNNSSHSSKNSGKERSIELIKYPLIKTPHSCRKSEKISTLIQQKSKYSTELIPDPLTYLLMKEKFNQIYHKITKMSSKDDLMGKMERRYFQQPRDQINSESVKIIHYIENNKPSEINKIRSSSLVPRKNYLLNELNQRSLAENEDNVELQINTMGQFDRNQGKHSKHQLNTSAYMQVQLMRKSRYRKKALEPLKKLKMMSNNIKDYLSVEKISIKEMEESLLNIKIRSNIQSNLLGYESQSPVKTSKRETQRTQEQVIKPRSDKPLQIKFKLPFQLYHLRDFIWKISFSNSYIVDPPEDYDVKIKMYVGPGNNSNLIKGIIKRRPWYQVTDKYQDANFIWTQIKLQNVYHLQKIKKQSFLRDENQHENIEVKAKQIKNSHKICKILNKKQIEKWQSYWQKNIGLENKMKDSMKLRTKSMKIQQIPMSEVRELKIHNHFSHNYIIGNKKALFKTMTEYYSLINKDPFNFLPLTFHIKNGIEDDEYLKFLQHFYSIGKNNKSDINSINKYNAWIVKPGENTNRGNGIIVCLDLAQIKNILKKKEKHLDGSYKTYILQKYIEKPLLYKRRKFDLRHYMMLNCSNGIMKGYWYREGYVRTTSSEYTLKFSNGSVHLTNDAVQKQLPDYGKFQKGNKISYEELNAYMKKVDESFDFWEKIYPQMKTIATDAMKASALNMDVDRRANNFEIFGMDFMIDEKYNVWLIEINTNPCLETTCPVLAKIIPKFIENTFQICLDPIFVPPIQFTSKYPDHYNNTSQANNFQLVFDQRIDQLVLQEKAMKSIQNMEEDQEDIFDDDGEDFSED